MNAAPRPLAQLTAGLLTVPADIEVTDVTLDSRAVRPGALFLACRGLTQHGLAFAPEAIARGARALLYDEGAELRDSVPANVFAARVHALGEHVGTIADRFFDAPSCALTVAGITGTNGKTTCAFVLAQALSIAQRPCAYVGTLGFGLPGTLRASSHTTVDAVSVHRQLAELRALGAECVAMEVSSHALDQGRTRGVRFHTAAFTNLTRDHLDYHGTMAAYGEAKARLFALPDLTTRVINVDDAFGAELAAAPAAGRLVVTSRRATQRRPTKDVHFVRATRVRASVRGLSIDVESTWGLAKVDVPLIGEFNVENVLTVLAVLLAWEVTLPQAIAALAHCTAPSGRMEAFGGAHEQPLVIVDYAHTPDALGKALQAVRAHCKGRLTVVFGCGGDRDAGKRPLMGRIAAERADRVVLTDDNPRTEEPAAIVAAIRAGMQTGPAPRIDHDRANAIRTAIATAGPTDAVLIAGKGHEDYQIYGAERRPFSDQAVVRAALGTGA
jgi:UDP-N-acetylmuramoyl-L-alanyl-D-glutamate--2,6-diaminopimelate ligase